ncbi:hypothetical protein DFH07DRAFT_829381 [Mycena maculata]|uniref:O-methyltransferase C-terminal domain-containing protein n=1 Tax=Mycena maculata TaxID=230809 RepID=A0AAD7IS51_9AGAR|nr:hypothetical protein DFH07DRAFT_829381 [Mycena maculata]
MSIQPTTSCPQPVKNADVFLLRLICHDWSDLYTDKILRHLRDAAQTTTKLIIVEHVVPLVYGEDETYKHIPGAVSTDAPPKPLLANTMAVNVVPYLVDLQNLFLRIFPESRLQCISHTICP